MKIERTKNSIVSIFWGIINKFVGIFGPFLTRTVLIYVLGDTLAGLNSVIYAILNVLNLVELGFSNAVVFSMYKPIANDDTENVCSLLYLFRRVYMLLGCIIGIVGLLLLPWVDNLISGNYPDNINIHLVYLVYLFNTVISYLLFAYKNSILNAHQRVDIISNIATIVNICMYVLQILALVFLRSYYLFILLMPVATIINNLITSIVVNIVFPQYVPRGIVSTDEKKDIYKNVKALIGHKIGGTIVTSADNIVISFFIGLEIVAYYNNYQYISSALISIIAVFMNSILGGLGNRIVCKSKEDNLDLFFKLTFGICWIVSWCSVCLLCLYQPFMSLWMGNNRLLDFKIVILIVLYFYSWQFRIMGLTFKDAAGMWREDFYKPYIGAFVNVILNIILVRYIGLYGVLMSTIVDFVVVYFPWETKVIFDKLFCVSPLKYYFRHLKYFINTIFVGVITYLCCSLVPGTGLLKLMINFLFCMIIPNVLLYLLYRKEEEWPYMKKQIINIVKIIKLR